MAKLHGSVPMLEIQQALAEYCGRSMRMLDSFEDVSEDVMRSFVSAMDTVVADLRVRNKGTQFEAEANKLAEAVQHRLNRAAQRLGMDR